MTVLVVQESRQILTLPERGWLPVAGPAVGDLICNEAVGHSRVTRTSFLCWSDAAKESHHASFFFLGGEKKDQKAGETAPRLKL